jgi:hypothetical protein
LGIVGLSNWGLGAAGSGTLDFIQGAVGASGTVYGQLTNAANWVTFKTGGYAFTSGTSLSGNPSLNARLSWYSSNMLAIDNGTNCATSSTNCVDLKTRHNLASGALPTLTTGTGTLDSTAADESGRVTLTAGSQTSIVVTFGTAYTNKPTCSAEDETSSASAAFVQAVPTTTTLTLNAQSTFGGTDAISWICKGH